MLKSLKAAKQVAVPLVGIETLDQPATIKTIVEAFPSLPIMEWDILSGVIASNEQAESIANTVNNGQNPAMITGNPAEMLSAINKVEEKVIVCAYNAHRILVDGERGFTVSQGIANLRNRYKSIGSMLVLLAPTITLPSELQHDVIILSEDLPNIEEVKGIINSITEDANMGQLDDLDKVSDTLIGLSAFEAEQTLAMCMERDENGDITLDRKALWSRKCQAIEQTPGLSIWRGGETFDNIGGCTNVKNFLSRILNGKEGFRSIVFLDEIEKMLAGSSGDTSGVSQDQLMTLLTFMQDKNVMGTIFIGPPGAAKSMVAKSAGNETNIPTISFDCGAMKASLVGESGKRMREALKVVDAISQGKTLFIATCNSITSLPPELRRRFTLGTFFFDLPNSEERKKIWSIYKKKYTLTEEQCDNVDDSSWTGAEIRNACNISYMLDIKLSEAAKYIVPVAIAARQQIENLQNSANGCYIDAGKSGVYRKEKQNTSRRKFE